jgi:hypothetical protein
MTRNAREQSNIWLMVKMSLGLLLLSLLLPAFIQNAHATSGGQKIQFVLDTYSVAEEAGSVTLHLKRTGGSFDTVASVTYCTCEGTAKFIKDFIHSPGTLIFYKGEQEKTITVPIVDDDIKEKAEQFIVKLIRPTGATLGDINVATVIIDEDDDKDTVIKDDNDTDDDNTTSLKQSSLTSTVTVNAEPLLVAATTPIPEITPSATPSETPSPTPTSTPVPTPTPKASDEEPALAALGNVTDMPNTATPWYNYIVVGALLVLLSGTMLYRRIAAFRRE